MKRLIILGLIVGPVPASCAHTPGTDLVPVETFFGGHVGQTQRLEAALKKKLASSKSFRMAAPSEAATLRIVVPKNVRPTSVDGTQYIEYIAEFTKKSGGGNSVIGSSRGRCRDRQIADCADKILQDLKVAFSNIPVG